MQVGFFPFEAQIFVFLATFLDAYRHVVVLEQLVCGGTLIRVLAQHSMNEIHQFIRVLRGNAVQFARFDFHSELVVRGGFEGRSQGGNFVDDAAE